MIISERLKSNNEDWKLSCQKEALPLRLSKQQL